MKKLAIIIKILLNRIGKFVNCERVILGILLAILHH